MITYCGNAVKLIRLIDKQNVSVMVWHSKQIVAAPINQLEQDDKANPNWTVQNEIKQLKWAENNFKNWYKKNQ